MDSTRPTCTYIYQLPFKERLDLCRLLDLNDTWFELGGTYMGIDLLTLQHCRRSRSPTDDLLFEWGKRNHTILELFVILSEMQHYQAMLVLEKFVDAEFHPLIERGEANLLAHYRNARLQMNTGNLSRRQNHAPSAPLVNGKELCLGSNNLNVNDSPGRVLNNKNPLAGVLKEVKINNTAVQNAGANSTAPTVQAGNHLAPVTAAESPDVGAAGPASPQQRKLSNASDISYIIESGPPLIDYSELAAGTNNWDRNCFLGRGGFGTVYKGTWKNTDVAIKKLEVQKDNVVESVEVKEAQRQQSLRELKYLNSHRHDNILALFGYSIGGEAPCLVYQYMNNGSLEDRLQCRQGTKPLSWAQRLNIALGTARGLQFLHSVKNTPLVHGDIKSANILLDQYFVPKIGDFGLAREGPSQQYTHIKVSRVHGTRPYLPDEFLRSRKFSTKVDTFSFGIVLFELATGQRAYEENRTHKFLKDHIEENATEGSDPGQLSDPKAGPDDYATGPALVQLGRHCACSRAKDRPDMIVVLGTLDTLDKTRENQQRAQCQIRKNSLTPVTPYEMQLFHDHMSQQRKQEKLPVHNCSQTPNPSAVAVRLNPPVDQPPGPSNLPLQYQGMCFATPAEQKSTKPTSNTPVINGYHQSPGEQVLLTPEQTGYPFPLLIRHPPRINVSPPSTPNFSELLPSQPVKDIVPGMSHAEDVPCGNTENTTYNEFPPTPCDDLPLMTELGIKPQSNP